MATIENAKEIRLHDRTKIFNRHFFNGMKNSDPRVIDEDVETAKLSFDKFEERLHLRIVADVSTHASRFSLIERPHRQYGFINFLPTASADTNIHTLLNEGFGNREAESLRHARD